MEWSTPFSDLDPEAQNAHEERILRLGCGHFASEFDYSVVPWAMRPNPGGMRGARNVLGVLFGHWRKAKLALACWLMGFAAGGALVAVDIAGIVGHTWPVGLALLVLFGLAGIGVFVGTLIAVKKIRGAIADSAGRFIFGAPQDHR
jgi:hypothetical protein